MLVALLTLLALLLLLALARALSSVKTPEVVGGPSPLRSFVETEIPILRHRFWPTPWASGSHLQSVVANLLRSRLPDLLCNREYVRLDDGGQVSLDWFVSPHGKGDGPPAIAVIVPGLTGSSQTEYVKSLVPELAAAGYTCVGFNQRSRGGTRLLTPRLYCAANCDDLKHALSHIRDQRPNSLIVAIGVSLGGIQLTRYLVQSGSASVVDAAILVSVIFDLIRANETLEQFGLNYLFNRALTSGVLKIADEERDMLQQAEGIDYNQVTQSKTLRQLDGSFTAPMFGYSGAEEYYRAASNAGQLHHVRIPTLCLSSADDFISPGPILPLQEIRRSRHVAMILTQRGGHIGFMDGLFPSLPFFSERLIGQYAAALLKLSDVRKELAP